MQKSKDTGCSGVSAVRKESYDFFLKREYCSNYAAATCSALFFASVLQRNRERIIM